MSKNQKIAQFIRSLVGRSMLVYLAIIMVMSLGSSAVFYMTAAKQLKRQLPPPSVYGSDEIGDNDQAYRPDFDNFFNRRIDEGNNELLERLVFINVLALLAGGVASYALARLTQRPIESIVATQRRLLKASGKFPELEEIDTVAAKTVTLQPVLLRAAIGKAIQKAPLLAEKKLKIDDTVPAEVKVLADQSMLTRLIQLILQNAAQYSAEKTTVYLSAKPHAKRVVISIRDEGDGIAASDLAHVFDEFYQADRNHPTKDRVGHGLGLALALAITQKNDGKLRIQSVLEQGTTLEIELGLA